MHSGKTLALCGAAPGLTARSNGPKVKRFAVKGFVLADETTVRKDERAPAAASTSAHDSARILLACMPKSGSTFLADLICALPEFNRARLAPSPMGRREQELDEACLRQAGRGNFVGQLHVRYSEWTAKMCREYRLKTVVLVRSLPDAVVSLRDHLRRESTIWPIFYADADHAALDDATLEDMIVRLAAPWYANFYMSWRNAPGALLISYEELIADPAAVLREVLAFAGAEIDEGAIAKALEAVGDRRDSRFNVGVAGRGAALRPETLRNLVALFDFYPEAVDDPYVKGVRAQAAAALEGRSAPPPLGRVATRPAEPAPSAAERPRRKSRLRAAASRYGYQVTLIAVGILYWIWPNDLLPDDKWYGEIDDATFLTILAFVAGRVTKRTPGLRDLPNFIFRGVRRTLRLKS